MNSAPKSSLFFFFFVSGGCGSERAFWVHRLTVIADGCESLSLTSTSLIRDPEVSVDLFLSVSRRHTGNASLILNLNTIWCHWSSLCSGRLTTRKEPLCTLNKKLWDTQPFRTFCGKQKISCLGRNLKPGPSSR